MKHLKLKLFILLICLLIFSIVFQIFSNNDVESIENAISENQLNKTSTTYKVELDRWNIYNNASHPKQTTKGFNDALKWASENKFTTFYVPSGTYLIDKGEVPSDPEARINMVSDMTLELDEDAVIKKEANGFENYEVLYIGPDIQNVTLKGGTYKGERESHDYTGRDNEYSSGTHEFGMGILAIGTNNLVIDGVKTINFTGDGVMVGGTAKQINILYEEDFEVGSIDEKGNLINDPTKIRTRSKTKTNFEHHIFETNRTIQFSRPKKISKDIPFDIYFYKSDGTFLSSVKNQEIDWSLVKVPEGAGYYHAVFDTPQYKEIKLEYWNKDISKNLTIKNSESSFNRRQGITVGGVNNMKIIDNEIHNIKGIAPQSGIDIEAGFYPNSNIVIRNNKIYDNERYNVILYDGQDVTVKGNYLGPNKTKSSIGLAISEPFRTGAIIKDNIIDGSKIVVEGEASFEGNKMNNALATFYGPSTSIKGMEFTDSQLSIRSKEPFGVKVSNITMYNNKERLNTLSIYDQPIHLTDVTIIGEAAQRNLVGEVAEGSIFDNLRIIGYNSTYGIDLPRGTYNNCIFESSGNGNGIIDINSSGEYFFNECYFKNKGGTINIDGEDINVTIQNSTFEVEGNGEPIDVKTANKVSIQNNKINVTSSNFTLPSEIVGITNDNDVREVIIKGNRVISESNKK